MSDLNKVLEDVSTKLRGLRAENHMTLEEVSKKIGIHRETLRRYENNESKIDIDIFLKLLDLYNKEVYIFFKEVYGK